MNTSAQDVGLDYVITGIEYNISLVKDVKVDYLVEAQTGKDIAEHTCTWVSKGEKEYLETKMYVGGNLELRDEASFDGQKGMTLNHSGRNKSGVISAEKPSPIVDRFNPRSLYGSVWHKDLITELKNGSVHLLPQESVSGVPCYVLQGKADEPGEFYYKIWIDPDRGFRPLRIEWLVNSRLVARTSDITLSQVTKDIWFPTVVTREIFDSKGNLYETDRMTVNSISVNQGQPDDAFALKYESGTDVWDKIANVGYTLP
jgi:outer membrane lipoprotein-sorting protein